MVGTQDLISCAYTNLLINGVPPIRPQIGRPDTSRRMIPRAAMMSLAPKLIGTTIASSDDEMNRSRYSNVFGSGFELRKPDHIMQENIGTIWRYHNTLLYATQHSGMPTGTSQKIFENQNPHVHELRTPVRNVRL
jgi:hypothetical protein